MFIKLVKIENSFKVVNNLFTIFNICYLQKWYICHYYYYLKNKIYTIFYLLQGFANAFWVVPNPLTPHPSIRALIIFRLIFYLVVSRIFLFLFWLSYINFLHVKISHVHLGRTQMYSMVWPCKNVKNKLLMIY